MNLILRTTIIFMALGVTMVIHKDDNLLARLGMTGNYAVLGGIAFVLSLMLTARPMPVIAIALLLSLAANMPVEYAIGIGMDRDYYGGFLAILVVHPVIERFA